MTRTVRVPPEVEPAFHAAEEVVSRFFASRRHDPEHGTIEIYGERYILVRAASLSVEFFALVRQLFGPKREQDADEFARNLLFDLAHALGRSDAKNFHTKMGLADPIARLSAGPVHFSHTGWAFVDILPESRPEPGDGYYLIYDHPYSFEAEAWARAEKSSRSSVCVMNAGYSSGWCEESFGLHLIASEILCRAKGDSVCRFIMAPPQTIEEHVRAYLDALAPTATESQYEVPDFFARKRAEDELRHLYDRLQELDTLKTKLFANVSHELRTPLAVILGVTERLLAETGDAARRGDLEAIARNASLLLERVNDLLEIAKLEAGRMELRYVDADFSELVRRIASLFEIVAMDRGIRFVVEVPPALPAQLDADKVERVLSNLLANAFEFVRDGGTVRCTLRTGEAAETAWLEVADDGPGIPLEARERVFERFVELGQTGRFGGTGLGLSIARELTVLHGGTVRADAAPEGGALLRVELPLVAAPGTLVRRERTTNEHANPSFEMLRTPPEPAAAPCGPADAPRVLIVEDNVEMSNFLAEQLSRHYQVDVARNGRLGLEKACERSPDLILIDIMMPELDGEQLLEELRSRPALEGVAIVVLTARADDAQKLRMLAKGAQDYLTKPVLTEELLVRARNLIGLKRTREVLQQALQTRESDIEQLARDLARTKRNLRDALEGAVVARNHAESAASARAMFLELVSQELETPLQTIRRDLDGCRNAGGWSGDQSERLDRLRLASGRLLELVSSLNELSKQEAERLDLRREELSLQAVAVGVMDDLRASTERDDLELRVRAPTDLPTVYSDERLVRLILVNLVSNAIAHTERGWVEIGVEADDEEHRLVVKDTGPGIALHRQVLLFEPFRPPEPRQHQVGAGIGLMLVRAIVAALGGRIAVSSSVGHGSCFTVHLPRR